MELCEFARRAAMRSDERHKNIVQTMISLAHNLQMKVVAEGAENAEQVSLLKSMDCDFVQGYFFFPPMQAAELEPLLEQHCASQSAVVRAEISEIKPSI
jgi:EAL domain-containing protein (putative c-di-GMP-specific phosphodiesterase class I)